MFVDINRGGQLFRINIDITLLRLPCDLVSIDVQDIMGVHVQNVVGTIHKIRLDNNQEKLEIYEDNT